MVKGIDSEFYQLLRNDWLLSIDFPVKMKPRFFQKYAERLFNNPYRFIKEARALANQDKTLHNWYDTSYIIEKTTAMKNFIDDLLEYCFSYGEKWRDPLMRSDYIKSLKNQCDSFCNKERTDFYRDHILHSGYVFLWGLWLYKNFDSLQKEHENMLITKPQRGHGSGCKALIKPNKDIRWQFFKQWVITSFFHDIGRFVEGATSRNISKRIELINAVEIKYLCQLREKGYIVPSPLKIKYNSDTKRLEMGLYKINYPANRAEEYISADIWDECLREISIVETQLRDDHGIHSAKILLKLANFSPTKLFEIYDQRVINESDREPWKRNSYRNYILPALAISKHNNPATKRKVYAKIPEIAIPIEMFKADFLTTLLIVSDDLAEFERVGGKRLLFGMDYKIELPKSEDVNNIKFSIVKEG